jgi:hypothetical protein
MLLIVDDSNESNVIKSDLGGFNFMFFYSSHYISISPRTIALPWRGDLCTPMTWRAMLVGADRPKGRGKMKCNPWSSRLGVGREANNPTVEKSSVTKPPEPMKEAKTHTHTNGCSTGKEEDISICRLMW